MRKVPAPTSTSIVRSRRFFNLVAPYKVRKTRVLIMGCGAIGSYVGLFLAKLGIINFYLIDDDVVELANVGVQAYGITDIDLPKVYALSNLIEDQGDCENYQITAHQKRFNKGDRIPNDVDIVIACTDNGQSRLDMWNALPKSTKSNRNLLYIDARVSAMMTEVWSTTIKPTNPEKTNLLTPKRKEFERLYVKSIHLDLPPAPCGAEGSPMAGPMVASQITTRIMAWLNTNRTKEWLVTDMLNEHIMGDDK